MTRATGLTSRKTLLAPTALALGSGSHFKQEGQVPCRNAGDQWEPQVCTLLALLRSAEILPCRLKLLTFTGALGYAHLGHWAI
jgi:hypothetical protein